jgi:hypothetical protein
LNKFCNSVGHKDSVKFGLIREKRFIFLGAIALFTVVSIVTSVGIGASSLSESIKTKNRLSTIEEESNIALRNIRELKQNAITEKRIYKQFNVMLQNLTEVVYELKDELQFVKNTAPKAMKAISLITTRLHYTKNQLLDISRDFKDKKLNIKFLDLFNYTVSCGDRCPPQYWNAINCYHDPVRSMILVRYTMKLINPNMHVMSADVFDLVTRVRENGKNLLCHSEYIGPNAMLYDDTKRCAKPLKGNPKESTNMVLVNKEMECTDKESFVTRSKYWIRGKCEERDSVDIHEIVQIKSALQYNYIYCASLNITIFNRDIACPHEVFVLPSNQSFKIADIKYDTQQLNLHSEVRFIPSWSYDINNHLDPHMRQNVFSDYFSKLNLSIDSLNTETFIENFDKEIDYHKHGNVFLVIVILVLCITFIFIIWKFKICNSINVQSRAHVETGPQTQTIELMDKPKCKADANINKSTDSKVILTLN